MKRKEIKNLQRELQLIESYLKDMDEVQRQEKLSHVLQTKIQHLRVILYEIEDFLDLFIHQKEQQPHKSCLKKFKSLFFLSSNPLIRKHKLVMRVIEIREELDETFQRAEKYKVINDSPQVAYRRPLSDSSIMKGEIIVGLEKHVNALVTKFIEKDGEGGANSAIVGMGGSGKTTLAKLLYNHKEIKEIFSRHAWICVTKKWSVEDLLLQICVELGVKLTEDEKSYPRPRVNLREFLERDSCLVVIDDVWEKKALEELLPTLLSGNGRVLITTRKENILSFPRIEAFYIHRARPLTSGQSWELFSKIVNNCFEFSRISIEEDSDYVMLGKEMLEKCEGLPLAIVTLASLLGTKTTIQQWKYIKERVISTLMQGDEDSHEAVKNMLELSYSDLPYDLKPCFLYLCIFKENETICAVELINLWVGERFVKDCDQSTLEEEGMVILEDLAQRCMIQVTQTKYGGVFTLRVHDLVRDFCIKKAEELGFFQVSTTASSNYLAIINDRYVLESHHVPHLKLIIKAYI